MLWFSVLAPCLFQGTCIPLNTTINNFRCDCPAGYTGLFCELVTDACNVHTCGDNLRCALSQYTHFTCVPSPYVIQIKQDVFKNLLFGSSHQWDLQYNKNVVYQLEILLRSFIQNTVVMI